MTQLRQLYRISFPGQDGIQNSQSAESGDVVQHAVDLKVHLIQRFLYVQNVFRRHFDETASVAPQRANRANHSGWTKAGPQQAHRVEILNPLAIGDVALSARNVLEVMCIDQEDLDPAGLQNLVQD